jgi:phospholipid-binding lipoprotein MlaA
MLKTLIRTIVSLYLTGTLVILSGCSFKNKVDPFEHYNRPMYKLNKVIDSLYIKPAAHAYNKCLPEFFKRTVNNFFQNLGEIPTIANDLLQFKFAHARDDSARFILNTTWGVGGLFDVASKAKIERHHEDFGETLAFLGYKQSAYFVLPIIGPSTIRDTVGRTTNYYMSVWPHLHSESWRYSLLGGNMLDTRVGLLKSDPLLQEQSGIDEYSFVRDTYLQYRQAQINEAKDSTQSTVELEGPPE